MMTLTEFLSRRTSAVLIAGFSAFALAACSTVADVASSVNPFDGPSAPDPDAPPVDQRISILAFEQGLQEDPNAGPVVLPSAYRNTIWPQADGYPTHALQHTAANGPLNILFRQNFGEESNRSRRINSRPIYADNTVFAQDGRGWVYALDPESGDEIWQHRFRNESRRDRISFGGGLAYDNGLIFAHNGRRYLIALNASSGEEVWRAEAQTPFHSAPTAINGMVFVVTDDNQLYAFSQEDGSIQWNHAGIEEPARLLTSPSVAVLGETVIVPYASGEITALRLQNGNPIWADVLTRQSGLTPISAINDLAASPVIVENTVYAMNHSGIMVAFDLLTGERQWTQPAGGLHAPWVAGDYMFFVTTEAEVVCMDRTSGTIRWITQLAAFANVNRRSDRIAWAGPVLASGQLFLTSSTGDSVFLDAETGEITRELDLRDPVFVAPIIANETIYVVTDDARLIGIR